MISVVVPWRDGCRHRQRALDHVVAWWSQFGVEVVLGDCPTTGWCKAAAVADGLELATGDVLVIADADVVLADPDDFARAVDALGSHGWAVPHRKVHRWDDTQTARIIDGDEPQGTASRVHDGVLGGGIVILTRALYEAVPLDPRFVGWGQEDESWGFALRRLAGSPHRGRSDLWHLWHPPADRMNRKWGSEQSKQLGKRYELARSPERMRQLIDEAKAVTA